MGKEKEATVRHFEKADQTYLWLRDNLSLLTKIGLCDLKHLIRFLCYIKRVKDDAFSKQCRNKKKI
jgi:hypothetical protein